MMRYIGNTLKIKKYDCSRRIGELIRLIICYFGEWLLQLR